MYIKLKLPAKGIFRNEDAPRWIPAQDADLLRLRAAGESFEAIGAVVGKSMKACESRFPSPEGGCTDSASVDEQSMTIRACKYV
jgi:hypothetical protein